MKVDIIDNITDVFSNWIKLKKNLHLKDSKKFFKEREIWWCALGKNIGDEENGKSEFFSRPVLIIKKFNNNIFFSVPLTTKIKDNKYYIQINYKKEVQCAMISQLRLMDKKRAYKKIGRVSEIEFKKVKKEIKKLF